MINKHGLKMVGLKKAAGRTQGLGDTSYVQISYDTRDGEILTDYHCSIGQNSWTQYHSHKVLNVCNAGERMTMQQIADEIAQAVVRKNSCIYY